MTANENPGSAGYIGDTLAELIRDELDKRSDPLEKRIIVNRIKAEISEWTTTEKVPRAPVAPMTRQEAIAFEQTTMEFGKYAGVKIADVPLDYLIWLADAGRKTWRQVFAYLNSERVKGELQSDDRD